MSEPLNFSLNYLNSTQDLHKFFEEQIEHTLSKLDARIYKIRSNQKNISSEFLEDKQEKIQKLKMRLENRNVCSKERQYIKTKIQLISEKYFHEKQDPNSFFKRIGVKSINNPSYSSRHISSLSEIVCDDPRATVIRGYLNGEIATPIFPITFDNSNGCCRGESKWFLTLYLLMKDKYSTLDTDTILEVISKEFKYGAKDAATILQSTQSFNSNGSTLPTITDNKPVQYAKYWKGNLPTAEQIVQSQLAETLKNLNNGTYSISLPRHRVALIKENSNFYLFDPNNGVIKTSFSGIVANELFSYRKKSIDISLYLKNFFIARVMADDSNTQYSYDNIKIAYEVFNSNSYAKEILSSLLSLKKEMKEKRLPGILLDGILFKIKEELSKLSLNDKEIKSFLSLLDAVSQLNKVAIDVVLNFLKLSDDPADIIQHKKFVDSLQKYLDSQKFPDDYIFFQRIVENKAIAFEDLGNITSDVALMIIQGAYYKGLSLLGEKFENKDVQAIFEAFLKSPQNDINYLKLNKYFMDNNLPEFNDFVDKMKLFFNNGSDFLDLFTFHENHIHKEGYWNDINNHIEEYESYIRAFSDKIHNENYKKSFCETYSSIEPYYPVLIYKESLRK